MCRPACRIIQTGIRSTSSPREELSSLLVEEGNAVKRMRVDREEQGWTEQILIPLCHSLESTVQAHQNMHPRENMGAWLLALLKEHAPSTLSKISEQVMFSHFSRLLSEKESHDSAKNGHSGHSALDAVLSLEEDVEELPPS